MNIDSVTAAIPDERLEGAVSEVILRFLRALFRTDFPREKGPTPPRHSGIGGPFVWRSGGFMLYEPF